MNKEYSAEIKSEVIERVVNLGEQIDKVATEVGVSRTTLQRWIKKYQELPEDPLLQDIRLEDTKKPGKNISIYLKSEESEELDKFMKENNFKNRSLCIRKIFLDTIRKKKETQMRKIVMYTDGSYRLDKQANATMIFEKDDEINKTLIYRVGRGTNNQAAELNSVIYGLEYIKEFMKIPGEECFVEIRCDELSIIDFIKKKVYNRWNRKGWRKGDTPIRSNIIQWYILASLVNYFGQQNIKAIKVKSKSNAIHNSADRVAHRMLEKDFMDPRQFYIVSLKENIKKNANIDNIISKSNQLKIPEFELDRSQNKMPWCQSKVKNEKKKENNIEYISWTSKIEQEIVNIPTKDIVLEEEIHLSCTKINFNGMLKLYKDQEKIEKPVAVRKISDNKYALVMGVQRYFAAKILDIKFLPAVITDDNHANFGVQMQELING